MKKVLYNFLRNVTRPVISGSDGFTLIEMMTVMVIIAILMGMSLPINKFINYKVQETRREVMYQKILSALEAYRADYGEYPINAYIRGVQNQVDDVKRHYINQFTIDTNGISPFTDLYLTREDNATNLFLPTDSREVWVYPIEFQKYPSKYSNSSYDYSLAWPLAMRPREEGKTPYLNIRAGKLRYVVYKLTERESGGGYNEISLDNPEHGISGNWITRPLVIDPLTLFQWRYYCEDGQTFYLWVTNNWSPDEHERRKKRSPHLYEKIRTL